MDLTHRFTVPTPAAVTWAHFQDIASVAECFPGASVTSVGDDTFRGSVKVKLGPVALVYNGSGTFVEKDESAHRFVVEAKGKDKRGNGTAGATVTLAMADSAGGTDVEVFTDLAITGKPAQFGRGVMQDVSDKLLGQFVACLETRLAGGVDDAPPEPEPEPPPGAEPSAREDRPVATDSPAPPSTQPGKPPPTTAASLPPERGDSLDLGATVLPVLARTYWRQGLVALLAAAAVVRALGRRSGARKPRTR